MKTPIFAGGAVDGGGGGATKTASPDALPSWKRWRFFFSIHWSNGEGLKMPVGEVIEDLLNYLA